jgi:hypothetical protein
MGLAVIEQMPHLSIVQTLKTNASRPRNRRCENIAIEAIIILELTFRDVEREILGADLVVAANDAPLEDRPEAFNRVRVDSTDDVTLGRVVNRFVIVIGRQSAIDAAFVGSEQANLVRNDLTHESFGVGFVYGLQDAGNDRALAAHSANDRGLSRRRVFAAAPALIPMLILVLAADIRFIDLDNAAKLHLRFDQRSADLVAHAPRGLVRAEAHEPHNLEGAHSFFTGEHQVGDLEPVPERLIRVLKDRTGDAGEAIAVLGASLALPMEAGCQRINLDIATTGANDPIGPPPGDQIGLTGCFVRESRLKLGAAHLVDWLRASGHGPTSFVGAYFHV